MADHRKDAYALLSRTAYNRDLRAVVSLAGRLERAIEVLEAHTPDTVTADLLALGLPPGELAVTGTQRLLADVEGMTGDASGFLWVLRQFAGIAECEVLADKSDALNGPGEVAPDAVVAGKAGA